MRTSRAAKFCHDDELNQQLVWNRRSLWLEHLGQDGCVSETVAAVLRNTSLCGEVRYRRAHSPRTPVH